MTSIDNGVDIPNLIDSDTDSDTNDIYYYYYSELLDYIKELKSKFAAIEAVSRKRRTEEN